MKKKFLSVLLLIAPIVTFAQEKGLDQKIDEAFGNVTGWFVEFIFFQIDFGGGVKVYWVLFPLILGATYFTFWNNFTLKLANIAFINFHKLRKNSNREPFDQVIFPFSGKENYFNFFGKRGFIESQLLIPEKNINSFGFGRLCCVKRMCKLFNNFIW